ncbi:hypothetical protein ASZ78_005215, partial [Callipepla squamata]
HDECVTNQHNCDENALCFNTVGGHNCVCKLGYTGNGTVCKEHDECVTNQHNCDENALCFNTVGGHNCVCKLGYTGNGTVCKEHDECVTNQHNCDENALCFNTVGGHNCVCKLGYTGNGTVCKAFCKDGCRNGGACIASNVCACPQGFTGPSCETDIDECSDGFVQCDSRANCINLPGWYHCECRDGYHDNGMFSPSGESCEGTFLLIECSLKVLHGMFLQTLMNVQLEGIAVPMTLFALIWMVGMTVGVHMARTAQETVSMKIKSSTMVRFGCWRTTDALSAHARSQADFCHYSISVFQQQNGYVMCRRMVCDCENPTVDLFCCPECDPRLSSQCLHQSGELSYNSGDSWIQNCQQCRCLQGEVDCWPLPCPEVDCEFSVLPENECCPRCVADPCQADTIRNDITKTCLDETNVVRFTGSSWIKHGTECTLCQCKVRSIKLKLRCCFSSLFCAHKY